MSSPDAQEQETEELEINFRLDENGRTAPTTTTAMPSKNGADNATTTPTPSPPTFDYRSQTVQAKICYMSMGSSSGNEETGTSLLDDLLFDCEIADNGLMPRTFWMPAPLDNDDEEDNAADPKSNHKNAPRCSLEQMALDVFRHHVPTDAVYDRTTSGAEWWVQIRPSPSKAGRYQMHMSADELNEDEISQQGIWYHWDKDEDLRQIMGGDTTYIHPHLSTVTYFTGHGAPTLAIDCRIHPLKGTWLDDANNDDDDDKEDTICHRHRHEAWISWPKQAKHLSFDGRYLHAAMPDLLPDHARDLTKQIPKTDNRCEARRHYRVTFLVNIWLNYHPLNVHRFPETMLDKMSGTKIEKRGHMVFGERSIVADECAQTKSDSWKVFTWPMGGCDSGEEISMAFPLERIRRRRKSGGNVQIKWLQGAVKLTKKHPAKKQCLERASST